MIDSETKSKKIRTITYSILLFGLIFTYIIVFPFLKKEDKKVTEIYFAERISSAHKILIERFNREYKGKIKVVPIDFPNLSFSTNERKELLTRSLRGRGDGIDLIAVDLIWVQRFAKWCEPLQNYFTDEQRKNFIEPVLATCYYEDKLVAIPWELVEGVLYYREDLLQNSKAGSKIIEKIKRGVTWDEFIKIKNELNSNNPFYIFPADNFEGLICSFVELVLSQDKDYFQKHGFNLKTKEARQALELLVNLVQKYNLTPKQVTDFTDIPSYKYFIENDGYFLRGWPTYDKDFINTQLFSEKSKYLKKAHIPYFANNQQAAVFGGWNLMIPKFTTKKEEVLTFLKFLLSKESQEILYKESGYFPVINNFYTDSAYIKKYPELTEYKEMFKYGVSRPLHEEYTRYSEIMSYYFRLAIQGQISVNEALEKATSGIEYKQVVLSH